MLRRVLMMLAGVLALGVLGAPAALAEEGCPNEAVRQLEEAAHPEGFATQLPDCRAYEQVTPVDKDGTNPSGNVDVVQASPDGSRIVFPVLANIPGGNAGDIPPFFLASRVGEGWSDRGLLAPHGPQERSGVMGWSEDLSEALVGKAEPGVGGEVDLFESPTGAFQSGFPGQYFAVYVVGFSADDSRVFFETRLPLSPNAAAGMVNLYELHGGVVSLVGVLPDGSAPLSGSAAGPAGPFEGGAEEYNYLERAVSRDGSRVFFTARGTEQLYVREGGTRTIAVGTGRFITATSDGSKAFYLAGGELLEFDVESEQTTNLAPSVGVQGVLGLSEDSSYVYYAGSGGRIYLLHDGTADLIATSSNASNWAARDIPGSGEQLINAKVSRVTPDGRFLLFTGSDGQLYRYDAVHGRLACVSCTLGGAVPAAPATLRSIAAEFAAVKEPEILLRNLSSDGGRVFFETSAALLPRDTNGLQNVYEWEQQGVGGCQGSSETFSAVSGGCLYLISSGRSSEASYFADASASGDDVFFFTDQPLAGQDQDGLVDVYDARVGGGFAAQNPPAPPAPCEGEGCKQVAGGVPVFGAPASTTFTGAMNLTPPPPAVTAPKPNVKVRHGAVKPKRKKKRRAKKASRGARGTRARGAMRGGK